MRDIFGEPVSENLLLSEPLSCHQDGRGSHNFAVALQTSARASHSARAFFRDYSGNFAPKAWAILKQHFDVVALAVDRVHPAGPWVGRWRAFEL